MEFEISKISYSINEIEKFSDTNKFDEYWFTFGKMRNSARVYNVTDFKAKALSKKDGSEYLHIKNIVCYSSMYDIREHCTRCGSDMVNAGQLSTPSILEQLDYIFKDAFGDGFEGHETCLIFASIGKITATSEIEEICDKMAEKFPYLNIVSSEKSVCDDYLIRNISGTLELRRLSDSDLITCVLDDRIAEFCSALTYSKLF